MDTRNLQTGSDERTSLTIEHAPALPGIRRAAHAGHTANGRLGSPRAGTLLRITSDGDVS